MTGTTQLILWALLAAVVLGMVIYGYIEYQTYLLRTSVDAVPGGLRFSSRWFTVESRNSARQVLVKARQGVLKIQPLAGGEGRTIVSDIDVALPAAGLHMEAARVVLGEAAEEGGDAPAKRATGLSSVIFRASDALNLQAQGAPQDGGTRSVLRLNDIPESVAVDFAQFAAGLRVWVEKIEHNLKADIAAREAQEQQAAAAAAAEAAAQEKAAKQALSSGKPVVNQQQREARVAEQVEQWRQAAGFAGTRSEVSSNEDGSIRWFIDLTANGRVILYAAGKIFTGTVQGAQVHLLPNAMELFVRAPGWTPREPEMLKFQVLEQASAQKRHEWRERLESLITAYGDDVI